MPWLVHQPLAADEPLWTDWVTAIGTAVAAAGIVFAAVGAWLVFRQVKETRRDRHIQVLSDYGRRWDDAHLAEARMKVLEYSSDDLAAEIEKWLTPPRETDSDVPVLLRVPNFFEDLAIMLECGELELPLVARSFGSIALREWEYWKPAIEKMRGQQADAYVEFEAMVKDLRALENWPR